MNEALNNWIKANCKWFYPILAMAIITPFTPFLDLQLTTWVYEKGGKAFINNAFWQAVFDYGPLPAQIVFIISIVIFTASFFYFPFQLIRKKILYLALCLLLGSGLIVNIILKDHWGRPRPKQVEQFGGTQEFRPFFSPNFFHQPEPSKSFPCGHCSMGFYFFAFVLLGSALNKRWLQILGIWLTILLGTILSIARILQGGHFLSDVLMSALLMWLVALFLQRIFVVNTQCE